MAQPVPVNAAHELLRRGFSKGGPAKTAFVDGNEAMSYGELAQRARHVAAGLAELGVRPEQRVLLVLLDTDPTMLPGDSAEAAAALQEMSVAATILAGRLTHG